MGKVVVDMSVSLDGFVADSSGGDGGLHDWLFGGSIPWEWQGEEFSLTSAASIPVCEETFARAGSYVMGRKTFQMAGEQPVFGLPTIVLSRTPRKPVAHDGVTATTVTEGIEPALELAREGAGDKDVYVFGGADVARQFLAAGLVDELDLTLAPVFIGAGARLLEGLGDAPRRPHLARVIEAGTVTHLRYRLEEAPLR